MMGQFGVLEVAIAVAASLVTLIVIKLIEARQGRMRAQRILDQAHQQAENDAANRLREADLQVKERSLAAEQELADKRDQLHTRQRELDAQAVLFTNQADDLRKQEKLCEATQHRLTEKISEMDRRELEMGRLEEQQRQQLFEVTGLSKEEATSRLLKLLEDELSSESGSIILRHEKKMQEICEQKSREILVTTMQRYAAAHTADTTTSTVDIPNEDMKGRIIGRDGRNIRAFEKATGVDVIIDDTPGVVIVSGFDPVRREISRQALETLIADGRIHPSRIEEIVTQVQEEMDDFILKTGEEAAHEVNVQGLHERLLTMLGRLHFRTSYSQNVLRHSVEVAFLTGMLAEMVGLDMELGRRCGLLHDIGKAADHELEGGHPRIGADLLKRSGEAEAVVHAARGHHDEIIIEFPYTVLVATADACSASRPGARRESLERYIKRMEELEMIAKDLKGVEQAFAIQAGRELRVIVSAKETDDARAAHLCREIARRFEEQLTYPGEIKVTVIRESRFSELAR
jgi:ribonuclease Y